MQEQRANPIIVFLIVGLLAFAALDHFGISLGGGLPSPGGDDSLDKSYQQWRKDWAQVEREFAELYRSGEPKTEATQQKHIEAFDSAFSEAFRGPVKTITGHTYDGSDEGARMLEEGRVR